MRMRVELWSLPTAASGRLDQRHQVRSATPLSADVTLFPRTIPLGTPESPELWAGSCSFYVSIPSKVRTQRQPHSEETAVLGQVDTQQEREGTKSKD